MISHNNATNKAARTRDHSHHRSHRHHQSKSDSTPRDDYYSEDEQSAPPPPTTSTQPPQRLQNAAYDPNASQLGNQESQSQQPPAPYPYSSAPPPQQPQPQSQAQQQAYFTPYAVRQPLHRGSQSYTEPSSNSGKTPPPYDRSHSYAAASAMPEPDAQDYERYGTHLDAPPPAVARSRRASSSSVYSASSTRPLRQEAEQDYKYESGKPKPKHTSGSNSRMGSRRTSSVADDDDRRPTYGDTVYAVGKGLKQIVKGHK